MDITDLLVVVGHLGEQVHAWARQAAKMGARLTCVSNPRYHQGNGLSLWYARGFVADGPFLVTMCDHIVTPEVIAPLVYGTGPANAMGVDRWDSDSTGEATKVWIEESGWVARLGKELRHWNAVDVGVFRFTPAVFSAIASLLHRGRTPELTEVVTELIALEDGVYGCDVSGAFWMDIDTAWDLARARQLLGDG